MPVHGNERRAAAFQVGDRAAHRLGNVVELEVGEDFLLARREPVEQLEITARGEKLQPDLVEAHRVAERFDRRFGLGHGGHVERDDQPLAAVDAGRNCGWYGTHCGLSQCGVLRRRCPEGTDFARIHACGGGRDGAIELRQHRGNGRPNDHHDPGDVHPKQENRDHGERAIDHRIGREVRDVPGEPELGELEGERRDQSAGKRVPHGDVPVGQQLVDQGKRNAGEHIGDQAQHHEGNPVRLAEKTKRHADEPRGHRNARPHEHGYHGKRAKINQHAVHGPALAVHPEKPVEGLVDAQHQAERRDTEKHQAHRSQLRGVRGEFGQLRADHPPAGVGEEIADREILQRLDPVLERGKRGGHREHDREQGDEGKQGREGETRGHLEAAVFENPADHRCAKRGERAIGWFSWARHGQPIIPSPPFAALSCPRQIFSSSTTRKAARSDAWRS